AGGGSRLRLWNTDAWKLGGEFTWSLQEWADYISFTPDGKFLVVGTLQKIRLLDPITFKELRAWADGEGEIVSVAFLPDGKRVCSLSVKGSICLWEAASGKELRRFPGKGRILVPSPDGKTLAGVEEDNSICLWEVASGRVRHRFKGHDAAVTSV